MEEKREIEVDVLNDVGFNWKPPSKKEFEPNWALLQYQNMYKSPDYIASKFSTGDFSHLPGFDEIIKNISNKMRTPYEEINSRYSILDDENGDNSNISQLKDCQ